MRLVDITPDLPMLVEIIDEEAKIQAFLPTVEQMVTAGVATLERVTVVIYRGNTRTE
jgi:PII-like signaling protein